MSDYTPPASKTRAEYGGVAKIIVAAAIAIALIVGTPIGLVTWGNVSRDNACASLPNRPDRLACLTGGTLQEQAVRQCGAVLSYGVGNFNQCMAQALKEPYGAVASGASASSTASGG